MDGGATLELGGATSQTVTFAGAPATLKLDDPSHFTGNIAGLAVGDVIEIATAANITVTSTTLNGSILTVNESNGQTLTFNVAGALLENDFHINNLVGGGADLVLSADPVAETPSLAGTATSVSGAEDGKISLVITPALSADAPNDPDSSLSLKIAGIPADATLMKYQAEATGVQKVMEASPTNPWLAQILSKGRDEHWQDVSHFIPMEVPERVARLIVDAL